MTALEADLAIIPQSKRRSWFLTSAGGKYSPAVTALLLVPLLVLLFFSFLYPVGRMLLGSVLDPEFTLKHYLRIFVEPVYLKVLGRTLWIALLTTVFAFILSYPVAFAMARTRGKLGFWVTACVLVPLWTSVLIRSYAWIILFQRTGVINTLLVDLNIVEQPLKLLYTQGAVIVAMTHVLMPFMILPIYGAVKAIPKELPQAAANLGAGRLTTFIRVIFPLSLPGVFAGTLVTFILALGFYVTPALIGGPQTQMMAMLIGEQATTMLDWPFAGALATVLLAVTLVLTFAFRRVLSSSGGFGHA